MSEKLNGVFVLLEMDWGLVQGVLWSVYEMVRSHDDSSKTEKLWSGQDTGCMNVMNYCKTNTNLYYLSSFDTKLGGHACFFALLKSHFYAQITKLVLENVYFHGNISLQAVSQIKKRLLYI